MNVIEKIRDLEATMCDEADKLDDEMAIEHLYELFNYIEDWEAVWTNSGYDEAIKDGK